MTDRALGVLIPQPPTQHLWEHRRFQFRAIEGQAMVATGWQGDIHEASYVLERELERSFLSGAWLACVLLSTAIVESCMGHNAGARQGCRPENTWLLTTALRQALVAELKGWRNSIAHLGNQKHSVTEDQYFMDEDMLEGRARRACRLGLVALFLTGKCAPRAIPEPRLREL